MEFNLSTWTMTIMKSLNENNQKAQKIKKQGKDMAIR